MKKKISIIGGGAAALALACFLDGEKYDISLFEKNKALGRKFLVAGKGGFNLTHSEPIEQLTERYVPSTFLKETLASFSNDDFRVWLASIGIETYVGSSKRVYPISGTKPVEVLKAIENGMANNGVKVHFEKTWTGWDKDNNLLFADKTSVQSDLNIFALGGGSWKVTGSDGSWLNTFETKGIKASNFEPSNCAYEVKWPEKFLQKFKGKPLKNIQITCNGKIQKGEAIVTEFGLEGNAIYGLSPQLREGLRTGNAIISIDFKPSLTESEILKKLSSTESKNTSDILKNGLKMSPVQLSLLKAHTTKEEYLNTNTLAKKIKSFELTITGIATLDEAISTVGGVDLNEVNSTFELNQLNNNFCIGEMLNWDTPTGGYLLQACFSMGYFLADHLNTQK